MRMPGCQPSVFPKMQERRSEPSAGALEGRTGLTSLSGGRKGRQAVASVLAGVSLPGGSPRLLQGLDEVEH